MAPLVSVLMPVRNAMPHLPACVLSIVAQRNARLELIAVDDGSTDGSREFMNELAACVGAGDGATDDRGDEQEWWNDLVANHGGGGGDSPRTAARYVPPTPSEVAAAVQPGCTLVVGAVDADVRHGPSGQGLALNTALALARGDLIGEMEADDLRPPWTFRTLVAALDAHPEWHAVTSRLAIFGWERPGMQRYVDWQNSLVSPGDIERGRFVEIPAQRASGVYRRSAVFDRALVRYRDIWEVDGALVDCAVPADHVETVLPPPAGWWPVDSDFWMRFHECGLAAGKLDEALYLWRQYPAQSTRTHSRTHVDRLGDCKAYYLARLAAGAPITLVGRGKTLRRYSEDLKRHGATVAAAIDWVPGAELPPELGSGGSGALSQKRARGADADAAAPAPKRPRGGAPSHVPAKPPLRVFVYGAAKARSRVVECRAVSFNAEVDWFAA